MDTCWTVKKMVLVTTYYVLVTTYYVEFIFQASYDKELCPRKYTKILWRKNPYKTNNVTKHYPMMILIIEESLLNPQSYIVINFLTSSKNFKDLEHSSWTINKCLLVTESAILSDFNKYLFPYPFSDSTFDKDIKP